MYNGLKYQVHEIFTFTVKGTLYCTKVSFKKPEQDQ
jgi:hypothetical protein